MFNNKRIIVSLTSWKKRINNVSRVVFSLTKQTLQPDSIEVNLSTDEFTNKENDLPEDLLLLKDNGIIHINWVKRNTGVFKKFIPVLQKYYGEDYYLISADDDLLYKTTYVEYMVKSIKENVCYCLNSGTFNRNITTPINGGRTIYRSYIFEKDFWNSITDKLISIGISDRYISEYIYKKKYDIKFSGNYLDYMQIYNPIYPNGGKENYSQLRIINANKEIDEIIGKIK